MKTLLFLIAAFLMAPSFAQEKAPTKEADQNKSSVTMHEQMAKAHQQAADCLKSGKSEEECRKALRETCQEAGGPDKCGPWMMHHKMERKGK